MPLRSELFRRDPAFERCLVRDDAHIVPGAVGPHVNKLHTALLALDGVQVDPRELAAGRYGPTTTAGILAYKRRRGIVNRAYQSKADDIVGKMTIASLDAEMFRRQFLPAPPPDPRDAAWTTRRTD